jgi:ATP-dependent Clp protease ATP-binding subunit ClpA
MTLLRRRRRPTTFELAPVVRELFAAAQDEANALHHDRIGSEHVLLALIGRDDGTGRTLRGLGLELPAVRADTRRLVGEGPDPAFDADALGAIGIDLHAVRQRVEATFGEGALERAARRQGRCGAAAFGISPRLKQALARARHDAERGGTPLTSADVAVALAAQRDSTAARLLDAHGISAPELRAALGGRPR